MSRRVALLTLDAWRWDRCSFAGYDRETTPFLDDLDIGLHEQCYSTSTHTREGVSGFLTGKLPCQAVNDDYEVTEPLISERIDVPSAAFHSNVYLSKAYGYARGFDSFYDSLHVSGNKITALGQKFIQKIRGQNYYTRGEKLNEMGKTWVQDQDDFFLWMHYMDTHGPYEAPGKYQFGDEIVRQDRAQQLYDKAMKHPSDLTTKEKQQLNDLYDAEVRYSDAVLEDMVTFLQQRGVDIYITADHGELLGEQGRWFHPRTPEDELLHVPLLTTHRNSTDQPISTRAVARGILEDFGHDASFDDHRRAISCVRSEDETQQRIAINGSGVVEVTGNHGHPHREQV